MGKTRKPRNRSKKVNPLGIPSLKDLNSDDELQGIDYPEGPIQAIMDQLLSAKVEDKMNALQSLAMLSQKKEKCRLICENNVVRTAAPFLMDTNYSIRHATAGALRNMSVNGVDICEKLVDFDVVTPLLVLLNEYTNTQDWIPTFDEKLDGQLDQRSDTFVQAISLLWNLCESTSVALDNFNQTKILQGCMKCLDYRTFGLDISIAFAQLLLVVSEDNPNAWCILTTYINELISLLSIDGGYSEVFLRSLIAGIISNVPALSAAHSNQIISALALTLDIDHKKLLCEVTSKMPVMSDGNVQEIDVGDDAIQVEEESTAAASLRRRKEDLPTRTEMEIRNIGRLLEAQRISAETITNMCSPDDEGAYSDDGEDCDSEAESVHDYDAGNSGSSTNLQNADRLPIEVQEAINALGIVEKLWQRALPLPENVRAILNESSSGLHSKVNSLRVSSLLCLQNLCNCLTTEDLGGPKGIYNVWLDLGQQVIQGQQDVDILEPATSLMRAALKHLKHSPELFHQMTENDLQLMLNGVQSCSESEIRANWLRMLGILGCLLPENLVKVIVKFILETCQSEYEAWTIAEALDALMDMFADNDWNQIAYELRLHQKVKELEKILKNKIRQQKNALKDRYPAVMTVRENLNRFAKYVENQLKGYTPSQVT